jgi:predicted DNA binding CopG/RHH family protein
MAFNTVTQAESKTTVTTTLRLPEELLRRAKKTAVDCKSSLQQLAREGLELRLRELEAADGKGKK